MSVRDAFTVVGTIVGYYFGAPQLGYAIGSAIGNAVDPQNIKGPSLGDLAKQTSMEGVPRPIIWAMSPPMAGNIIASSEPKIVRKRQRQGKGGPKVETEHVYRTYAVGVCEGPITRFVRIWRNNQLVFDVSEFPQRTNAENIEFMKHARFFFGTFTQNASPDLEAVFGVGLTPSHRGTAYMVMDDEELTDLRGAIPQWTFQVERCEGTYVTSRPYPLQNIDALDSTGILRKESPNVGPLFESIDSSGVLLSGSLGGALVAYDEYPPEALDSEASLLSGDLNDALLAYDEYPPEAIDSTAELLSGDLNDALITYDEYPPERIDSTGSVLSGSLV